MRRTMLVLLLTALMALPNATFVGASGGNNPGTGSSEFKVVGPAIHATVVVDPHLSFNPAANPDGKTPTEGWPASIRLRKEGGSSAAEFQIDPSNFPLFFGCLLVAPDDLRDLIGFPDLTAIRFLNVPLNKWVPAPILTKLISDIGVQWDSAAATPLITDLENVVCTVLPPSPVTCNEPGTPCGEPGTLSFDALVKFRMLR